MNYHGPYNTGLPDYFYLEILPGSSVDVLGRRDALARWGMPYLSKDVGRLPTESLNDLPLLTEEWEASRGAMERRRKDHRLRMERQRIEAEEKRRAYRIQAENHQRSSEHHQNHREETVELFLRMKPHDRARALLTKWPFSIDAYPIDTLPIEDGLSGLTPDERNNLSKLIGNRRGRWAPIRKRLSTI